MREGLAADGFADGTLGRPALTQTGFDDTVGNAGLCFPLAHREALPKGFNVLGIVAKSLVLRLCHTVSPTAVIRFVVSVVVNTVYAERGVWARPHVSQEVLKGMTPAVTNGNPACSIFGIGGGTGSITAAVHVQPSSVFLGSMFLRSLPVSPCRAARTVFDVPTPAGFRVAFGEVS